MHRRGEESKLYTQTKTKKQETTQKRWFSQEMYKFPIVLCWHDLTDSHSSGNFFRVLFGLGPKTHSNLGLEVKDFPPMFVPINF